MKNVIIYGNGPVACVCYFNLKEDSNCNVVAFTVDRDVIKESALYDLPVVPFEDVEATHTPKENKMIIAVGYRKMNKLREERYSQAKDKGYQLINYISSKASLSSDLSIGDNCMIGAFTTIQPGVKIGNNVIIRENCFLGHGGEIKDHCFIAAGATLAGNVSVDRYCFLGVNSSFREGVRIAQGCLIGAGVTMLNDTKEKEVYGRPPAQKLPFPSDTEFPGIYR
jgi:sugar O-acyltransferase (sialic acid O-acetyltransferase NeuD family)